MNVRRMLTRDRLAVLAGVAAPLALAAILVPFRAGFPNTDATLALILVVVAVAANGHRPAGLIAALSAAAWFDYFLTRPYERFAITRRADIETTVLLLVIGAAVTELAVRGQLTRLLSLRSCSFQYGAAGLGGPARMLQDGRVVTGQRGWDVEHEGWPPGQDVELLVENAGVLQGRFLMAPLPGTRPGLEQRLLARRRSAAAVAEGGQRGEHDDQGRRPQQ
jgi:hypothetical protein